MILLEFNVGRWYRRRQPKTTSHWQLEKDRCFKLKMVHTRIWQGKHDRRPKLGGIELIAFSTHAQQHITRPKIKETTSKQVANDAPKLPAW
jgi:hypothetical protein